MSTGRAPGGSPAAPTYIDIDIEGEGRRGRRTIAMDISAGNGAAVTASRPIIAGTVCRLKGWSLVETTGAAGAAIRLHDGSSTGGGLIAVSSLASGASDNVSIEEPGVYVSTGKVYLEVKSGSVAGVLYLELEGDY